VIRSRRFLILRCLIVNKVRLNAILLTHNDKLEIWTAQDSHYCDMLELLRD
jgi:hypothetical protein